jgi:hypothetical protein
VNEVVLIVFATTFIFYVTYLVPPYISMQISTYLYLRLTVATSKFYVPFIYFLKKSAPYRFV